jgi:hypothetical protein
VTRLVGMASVANAKRALYLGADTDLQAALRSRT